MLKNFFAAHSIGMRAYWLYAPYLLYIYTRTYFTYIPESYTKDFPKYSVKVLGETLYHDPYA